MKVLKVTIPSIDEWYDIVSRVPNIPIETKNVRRGDFWLQDPGMYSQRAACVDENGNVHTDGANIHDSAVGIKPIVTVDTPAYPGRKAVIKSLLNSYTYISENEVFADHIIYRREFGLTNKYSSSELKRFVESEAFKFLL